MVTHWYKLFGCTGLLVVLLFSLCFPGTGVPIYAGLIDVPCLMHFMVSTDGGDTWVEKATPGGAIWEIHAITPDSITPENVYISQGSGIYLSTNYGSTWSSNLFPYNNVPYVHDVKIDPLYPEWLWATSSVWPLSNLHDTVGVFLSTNSGNTWEYAGEGLPYISGGSVAVYCIAIGSESPRVAYVGTWEAIGDTTIGVYKRDISSDTARWQYTGLRGEEAGIKDIAVDPEDQDICFAITGFNSSSLGVVWRTFDGGVTWEKVLEGDSIGGTIDWDFEYQNGILYVPVFGKGIYKSTDKGDTWECYSTGLNLAVSCVSVSHDDSSIVYAGCQPSVSPPNADPFYKSTDGGYTWFQTCNISQFYWCVLIKCGYSEVGIEEIDKEVKSISTLNISPNPARSFTELFYQITKSGLITIELYDISGRKIKEFFSGSRCCGEYVQKLDTSHLSAGIYFVRVFQNKETELKKLIVLK